MSIFNKKISEKDVKKFLKENPDFFLKNPEALEELEIKHASGEAVSLIERQVEIIKKKNLLADSKLSEFLSNAEFNQKLFIKVQKLILIILKSETLNSLSEQVEIFFKKEFGNEKCKIFFFTQEELFDVSAERIITPEIATPTFSDLFSENVIYLGGLNKELSTLVFGGKAMIKEGAICRLASSKIAGALTLGSSKEGKFAKDSETLFLEFVIDVMSHKIDSLIGASDA
ncbi:MAG: DUF484 family protein [Gammaproteobacteria bacterium]|nr:MAG: DUF484 family protein [Gammaproteobacteria bacterium]